MIRWKNEKDANWVYDHYKNGSDGVTDSDNCFNAVLSFISLIKYPEKYESAFEDHGFLKKTVEDCLNKSSCSKTLLDLICEEIKSYLKKDDKKYHLLVEIGTRINLKKIDFYGYKYQFYSEFPEPFRSNRKKLFESSFGEHDGFGFNQKLIDKHYQKVIIDVSSKSSFDALSRGLYFFDAFRLILSLFRVEKYDLLNTTYRNLGHVRRGVFATIHNEDGSNIDRYDFCTDSYLLYYGGDFREIDRKVRIQIFEALDKFEVVSSKFGRCVGESFVNAIRGLDSTQYPEVFTKLWTSLEILLLMKGKRENYDQLTKMLAKMFKNSRHGKIACDLLREYRNENVHNRELSLLSYDYAYQIKELFFQLCNRLLFRSSELKNIEEFRYMFSIPRNKNQRARNSELFHIYENFIGY